MINILLKSDVIERLPSPKGVALGLLEACRSESSNLGSIAELVRTDPALCGRILALANAASTGGRTVVSIDDAIVRMGTLAISRVALAFSLVDHYSAGHCINFNYAGFWNQSLLMAAASQELASSRKLGGSNEQFTVGLLAQVGKLGLATAFPVEYSKIVIADVGRIGRLRLETSMFGFNHVQLSVALNEHWGIPSAYAKPFALHEEIAFDAFELTPNQTQLAQLAHSAWTLASTLTTSGSTNFLELSECSDSLNWLNLSNVELTRIVLNIESVWHAWLKLCAKAA